MKFKDFEWSKKPELSKLAKDLEGADQKDLRAKAKEYIQKCPCDDLENLSTLIESAKKSAVKPSAFYTALTDALYVRNSIEAVLKESNTKPARFFLAPQYSSAAFDQYRDLALELARGREKLLIETMMGHAINDGQRSELCQNIRHAFGAGSQMDMLANRCAIIIRQVGMLHGDNAIRAFLSKDFSVDAFHEFQSLLEPLLINHKQDIATRLSRAKPNELSEINRKLEQLAPTSVHRVNIFSEIKNLMPAPIEPAQSAKASQSGMFGTDGFVHVPLDEKAEKAEKTEKTPLRAELIKPNPGCCILF